MSSDIGVALGAFKDIADYRPQLGDFIIWGGWFSTSYGIVIGADQDKLTGIFERTPRLLLTSNNDEMKAATKQIPMRVVRGYCYALQEGVWYI